MLTSLLSPQHPVLAHLKYHLAICWFLYCFTELFIGSSAYAQQNRKAVANTLSQNPASSPAVPTSSNGSQQRNDKPDTTKLVAFIALPNHLTLRITRRLSSKTGQSGSTRPGTGSSNTITNRRALIDSAYVDIEPIRLIRNYTKIPESGSKWSDLKKRLERRINLEKQDSLLFTQQKTYPLTLRNEDLVLQVRPVYFDPLNYTPDSVVNQLYLRLARAGHQARPGLKQPIALSGQPAEWNTWLPQRHILLRSFSDAPSQRLLRQRFRYDMHRQLVLYSEQVADSIERAARRNSPANDETVSKAVNLLPATQPAAPVSETKIPEPASVLYDREIILPTVPLRRILHVTINDRGASAQTHGQPRYSVCVRYTTRTSGKYQGLTIADGCAPQTGFVTASVDLVRLEREIFVEKITQALDTSHLKLLSETAPSESAVLAASKSYLVVADTLNTLGQRLIHFKRDSIAYASSLAQRSSQSKSLTQQQQALEQKLAAAPIDTAKVRIQGLLDQTKKDIGLVQTEIARASRLPSALKEVRQRYLTGAKQLATARVSLVQAQQRSILAAVRSGEVLNLTTTTTSKDPEPPKKSKGGPYPADYRVDTLGVVYTPDMEQLRNVLLDVFLEFLRLQERYLAAPKAGTLLVSNEVRVYNLPAHDHSPRTLRAPFLLDSVQMKVEDGNITDLKAVGNVAGREMLFESDTPIGISSDVDLNSRRWYQRYLWSQGQFKPLPRNNHIYIQLDELIRYFPSSENEDRSPADGVYTFRPNDPLIRRTLWKEPTAKILQAHMYTDLAGVENGRPNGLVQVEVSKKIMFGSSWTRNSPNIQLRSLGYVMPLVAITKVEKQNRTLPLTPITAPTVGAPPFQVNTIDLLRYTRLRVGMDLNLLGLRFPQYKSEYSLDFGLHLHRVSVQADSLVGTATNPDSALNVAAYGLHVKWRIRPDSRYGIQARLGYIRYALINGIGSDNRRLILQTPEAHNIHPGAHTMFAKYFFQGVMQYELMGWLRVSDNSKFFIRPQFSHLLFQASRTFFQFQVGYQFDVFTKRRDVPIAPASLFAGP